MLDKLSDGFRASLGKIRDAVFVDDTLVNEVTRDVQRALLSADVNVRLVMELTARIKARIKEDPPKGLTRKDYFVTVLYEELTTFLGGAGAKIQVNKKPFIIMLVGLFGNGKCIHKDSQVLLANGESLAIAELYQRFTKQGEEQLEDGFIIELDSPLLVESFNQKTLKIEHKAATHLWKLEGKELYEIKLENGNDQGVRTTPEHPFFTMVNGVVVQKRADELRIGDFVAVPKQVHSMEPSTSIDENLGAFLGYILGDGYLSKQSVHVSTADQDTVTHFTALSAELFNKRVTITADKRSKALNLRINSVALTKQISATFSIPIGKKGRMLQIPKQVLTASTTSQKAFIRAYFDCDGYFSPKQRQIELVSESKTLVIQMQHMLLAHGIAAKRSEKILNNKSYGRLFIEARYAERYATIIGSQLIRKQTVLSSYKDIGTGQGDGSQDMLPVGTLLRQARDEAGCTLGQIQSEVTSYGLYERKERISRSKLSDSVSAFTNQYGNYRKLLSDEAFRTNTNKATIAVRNAVLAQAKREGIVQDIINDYDIPLSEQGLIYVQELGMSTALEQLQKIANADVFWAPVKSINKIANEHGYVYDLTVEDNHSFIADGIVVHNTTTAGKLAKYYTKRGMKVALVSTDTWRPAAAEQLAQLGKQVGVPVFINPKEKDPVKIWTDAWEETRKADIIICDTAGRDALNDELVEEITSLRAAVAADEVLLVMAADVGQSAEKQAKMFHETCGVTGVVITKLDGTAKGGGALSACSVTNAPVKFIGVGEKVDALEEFEPKRFVGRLLGMGDLETLLEKAKEAIDEGDAKDMQKRLLKGDFTLIDLYQQMEAMKKMGPLSKVMELIPGMGQLQMPKEALAVQEEKLKTWKFVMDSMTREELQDPEEFMNPNRVSRIALGSGRSETEVRELLKQHKQSKKLFKMLKGRGNEKDMKKMMQKMQQMRR